jgi:hypothetical protein
MQLVYASVPKTIDGIEVLGWVNLGKVRWAIIKRNNNYYRAELVISIEKEVKGTQMPSDNGGYEFPLLTNIKVRTFNGSLSYSPSADESKNVAFYEMLVQYKKMVDEAGQIFY